MIIGTLPYYIDELNSNQTLRPLPSTAEKELLDQALLILDHDPEADKSLCLKFLHSVLDIDCSCSSVNSRRFVRKRPTHTKTPVSKRKVKRKLCNFPKAVS